MQILQTLGFIVIATAYPLLSALAQPPGPAQPPAAPAPGQAPVRMATQPMVIQPRSAQQVVEFLIEHYNIRQMRGIADYVEGARLDDYSSELGEELRQSQTYATLSASDFHVDEKGEAATVSYRLRLTDSLLNYIEQQETLQVRRITKNGDVVWQAVPPTPASAAAWFAAGHNGGWLNWLAACAAYPQMMLQLSRTYRSVEKIKQIGAALLQYCQDNDLKFPPRDKNFSSLLRPYTRTEQDFLSPGDEIKEATRRGQGYALNSNLSGLNMASLKNPERVVMLYESAEVANTGEKLFFRDNGQNVLTVVLFADEHVEIVSPEQASKLQWKP